MRKMIQAAVGLAILVPTVFGIHTNVAAASGKITASTLHVRTAPSTTSQIMGDIYKGNIVTYNVFNNDWVTIQFNGKTAYLAKAYVQDIPTVSYDGKVTASSLRVRSSGNTTATVVGSLPQGTIVHVSDSINGWLYVTAGTTKGWVFGQYVEKVTAAPVATDYKMMDIRYPSRVTATEINRYIEQYETIMGSKSVFHGKGQAFINIATEAGINQLLFTAMAMHESSMGTNELAVKKYNIFSVGAFDSDPYYAYTFQSVEHSLVYQAKFLQEGYLNTASWRYKGPYLGDGAGGLNYYYAMDKQWGEKIAIHANKIHPFQATEYTGVSRMVGTIPTVADPIKPPAKQ